VAAQGESRGVRCLGLKFNASAVGLAIANGNKTLRCIFFYKINLRMYSHQGGSELFPESAAPGLSFETTASNF
jgi:hypothetical protein